MSGMSDVIKPDPSFFEPFQEMIDASIASAELGDLTEAQVQAIVDAAVGTAETDDLTEPQVQAMIDTAIAGIGESAQPILHKFIKRATGSSMVLNSTAIAELAAATNGPGTGGFDISLPAAVGDVIEWSFNGLWGSEAVFTGIDIYTLVAGARVNPFGPGVSVSLASGQGVAGWRSPNSGVTPPLIGSAIYALQNGDIVDGVVTLRPYYAQVSATNKTLASDPNAGLQMWAKNLGPVAS